MSKKFQNKKKDNFLKSLPQSDIETSKIEQRCKFNFSYFDASQPAGQDFSDWYNQQGLNSLSELLKKMKEYTKHSLSYWQNQRVGGGGLKILAYYEKFPINSDFIHPTHIPHDVIWARFRLGNKVRLIGFVIPEKFAKGPEKTAKIFIN
jgi:hypothetical protein